MYSKTATVVLWLLLAADGCQTSTGCCMHSKPSAGLSHAARCCMRSNCWAALVSLPAVALQHMHVLEQFAGGGGLSYITPHLYGIV
jgi:hypothetical protein